MQLLIALRLSTAFLDNSDCTQVTNYEAVTVCISYENTVNTDEDCTGKWGIDDTTFTARAFTNDGATFQLCEATCSSSSLTKCFNDLSTFINTYTLGNDEHILAYTSVDDTEYKITFATSTNCVERTYTEQNLLAACLTGWRSHHGTVFTADNRQRRQDVQPQRFNNRFEPSSGLESTTDTAETVAIVVGATAGTITIAAIAIILYNRTKTVKFATGEFGQNSGLL